MSVWMRVCMLYIVSLNIYYLWHSLYVNQLLVRTPFNYNLIIWHIQFCIIFVHLKVSFQITFERMQLWYSLVNFAFINKELCLQNNQIIKSKVLSRKWMSWPNSTIFSLSVTDVAFGQPALSTIWNCSQNDLTYVHDQNIWLSLGLIDKKSK